MKQKFNFWVLLFAVLSCSFTASARELAPTMLKAGAPDVGSAIQDWKSAVEGRDVEAIAALYDKNAIMISTFVQNPLTTNKALTGYYKKVVSNPDVRVEIEEEHPRRFGDMAVNTGKYTLSYTQEGEEVAVPARFSFTYQLQGKKWMIVDHHSSAVPMPQNIR
ncbi:MAG: DUF4440 domain-containing protein [Pseudomonadota bacterium]